MRVLVDTSVWSGALRRAKRKAESIVVQEFRNLILEHRVDIIGPVRKRSSLACAKTHNSKDWRKTSRHSRTSR